MNPRLATAALAAGLLARGSIGRTAPPALGVLPHGGLASAGASPRVPVPIAAGALDSQGRYPVVLRASDSGSLARWGVTRLGEEYATLRLTPAELELFESQNPKVPLTVGPPLRTLLDRSAITNRSLSYRARTGRDGKGVVVGIIDTGVDVAHADFRDAAGHSRIAWYMDFSKGPLGVHPELEARYGCTSQHGARCAIWNQADLDQALTKGTLPVPTDSIGHGTHVASIAAGDGGDGPEFKYVGGAPGASLIVVGVSQSDGGNATDPDLLNGAQFIFDRASEMGDKGWPAVINISLGSDFGAHDGTSVIEKGLASLVGQGHPGRSIVVAAGNSGSLYREDGREDLLGIHTAVRVLPDSVTRIPLRSPTAPSSPDLKGWAFVWITMGAGDDISVGLDMGSQQLVEPLAPGDKSGLPKVGDLTGIVANNIVDDVSPLNAGTVGAVVEFGGTWPADTEFSLVLHGRGSAELWVEGTGDLALEQGNGVFFRMATVEGTVSVPASDPSLIAVGCTLNRVSWNDAAGVPHLLPSFGPFAHPVEDSVCYFSGAGATPRGVFKPDLSAPGAFVAAAMAQGKIPSKSPGSIFEPPADLCFGDCLLVDGTHALLSGSSMSAPQVSGAVALMLERDGSLTQPQIATLLKAGARRPAGLVPRDAQLGVGALDVEGTMAALERLQTPLPHTVGLPDPAKSWMALSSSYVRPDPSWHVVGEVELRDTGGGAADPTRPEDLTLDVQGGEVKSPLSRVGDGLYRFEVSGNLNAGGTVLDVAVRYGGVAVGGSAAASQDSEDRNAFLGTRQLPVALDPWLARQPAQPTGGCSSSGRSPALVFPWTALLALVASAWRGSRWSKK